MDRWRVGFLVSWFPVFRGWVRGMGEGGKLLVSGVGIGRAGAGREKMSNVGWLKAVSLYAENGFQDR